MIRAKTEFKRLAQVLKGFTISQLISLNLSNSCEVTPLNQRVPGSSPGAPTSFFHLFQILMRIIIFGPTGACIAR